MQNKNKDALVDGKEHDDDIQKSVSPDIHSSSSGAQTRKQGDKTENKDKGKSHVVIITGFRDLNAEFKECTNNSSNGVNAASSSVSIAGNNFINNTNDFSAPGPSNTASSPTVANSSSQDASTSSHDSDMPNLEDLTHSDDADAVGEKADINNLESIISVSLIPTTRIHKESDLSNYWAIGTKWAYKNKKDERGIVIRNKPRLVAQGHTQEEGIDYEEVFAPVARIEAIRLFLAYASFMGFLVYQIDVKSAFLYGTIKEEVYVCQPPGFEDPKNPDKYTKWSRHFMDYIKLLELGLQVKQKKDGIFISQYKYIAEILRKFRLSEGKSASTPIDAEKPLLKDSDGEDVDVHTYRVLNLPMLHLLRVEMVINSPWMMSKNWLVQKQMALGKDSSNPVIVDSLLKTIWFSIHHHLTIEVLAIPGQTTTGVNTPRSNEDRLKLMKLMVFLLQKGFWNTASVKHSDDVTRLQALVDRKKIVISEDVIRKILQLDDAEGVVCFPNEEIFAGLAQMGYEKPSTKLTFYKAFFSNQWKFLIHALLQSLSTKRTSWNEFSMAMASAVFANMRRVGKGFSGVETPLFEGMLAARQLAEEGIAEEQVQADDAVAATVQETVANDAIPSNPTPLILPSPPSHDIPSNSQDQSSPPQQPQSSPQAPPQAQYGVSTSIGYGVSNFLSNSWKEDRSVYLEWPTCSWKEDRYCNGGNLPRAYIVGNTLCYQDLEWYDALKDSELKDEALRNKAIMEGLIDEDDE
nr:hypothetical protein [Tanacetum cinerariifolium]